MTDTFPFGCIEEVCDSGEQGRAVSAQVQGADGRACNGCRSLGSLAREFEPSEQTIRNWVRIRQADLDEGLRSDGLTTEARKELPPDLKLEVTRLRMERDILKKAAAWFARESGSIPGGVMRS